MANIGMNQNNLSKFAFQKEKKLNDPKSGINGASRPKLLNSSSKISPVIYLHDGKNNLIPQDQNRSYLPFAAKLKHLLENGTPSEQCDKEDPYAFRDVELTSLNPPANGIVDFNVKSVATKSGNAPPQRSKVDLLTPSVKFNSHTVASHATFSTPVLSPLSPKAQCVSIGTIEQKNEKSSTMSKPLTSMQLSNSSKLSQIYSDRQLKCEKLAPYNGRIQAGGGKPLNFGKSQMSKLAIAKIEKSMENKRRNGSKVKHLISSAKTAPISKLINKTMRPNTSRSSSLESETPTSKPKITIKKSLLEESLMGVKQNDWLSNRIVACGSSAPLLQTATTTVPVSPRHRAVNDKALQTSWALRNKVKLLRKNYQSFGLLIDESTDKADEPCEEHIIQDYSFSLCTDSNLSSGHSRHAKLAQLKSELRHKLQQQQQWRYRDDYRDEMAKFLIQTARKKPNLTAFLIRLETSVGFRSKFDRWKGEVEMPRACGYHEVGEPNCVNRALPYIGFCKTHILRNHKQLLFTSCSAISLNENLPCSAHALGRISDQAYCSFHQRLQTNFQKPKKITADTLEGKLVMQGKRNRSSHSSSRTGRSRKRKRQAKDKKNISYWRDSISSSLHDGKRLVCLAPDTLVLSKSDVDESQDVEVGDDLPLDSEEIASLATQATRLLEEHDFNNVLNHIPADLNDLFAGDKEEYEPTLQETEELERALEAVDNDVKSLEKLTQTHGILDMLDEQTIAQTLAALPEVVPALYQNGFAGLSPIEQSLCSLHPDAITALPVPPQTDLLQS